MTAKKGTNYSDTAQKNEGNLYTFCRADSVLIDASCCRQDDGCLCDAGTGSKSRLDHGGQRYLAEAWSRVELVYLGGGSRSVPALLSGSIQLFMGSDTAAYVAAIQGAKIVKIGVTMNTLGYFLMTTPEIRSIADLKGKVLGISLGRDLPYAHLSKILRDHGIDPKTDVKFLPLGGGPGGYISALKAGRVQASMLIPPNHLVAEKAGLKALTKIDVPTLAGGLNTTQLILEKNRDTFIRFLKGSSRAFSS
jgi:ABC-type nitrate/sulfonate/bicarbonate transport system substrate-binding protein